MIKLGQGLTLQQSPKHPGLVSRFLHGHQVLNLTEGHHLLDPILWASILEDSKLSGVLGSSGWIVWIHEELQVDPLRLVRISPINLVHLLHLGNKGMGASCAQKESNQRQICKTYSWLLSGLKFFKRTVITVLYVERTIAIYDGHLFYTISRIGSCMSNRDVTRLKYLKHCVLFVKTGM
jgi:hypothetical protein